jgi:nucleoside-diphosphate-sugar epimerase
LSNRLVAVTGATGFLGRHIVRALAAEGWTVRALVRRDPVHELWRDLEPQVVFGDLADPAALARLCAGADVVVHAAGLIKARSRQAFFAANAEASRSLAVAMRHQAPEARMVLISSLAAREPQLSDYAASKRAGEASAREVLGSRITVVRPPAIYGPGDVETLALFKAAAKSPLLPVFDPSARIAMIHVDDAARIIARLASEPQEHPVCPCDARPDGYSWRELMEEAARACGATPRLVRVPAFFLRAAGLVGGLARFMGSTPMLTPGKTRELLHADWSLPPGQRFPGASSSISLPAGFRQTVRWYRAAGWLDAQ